jgi:branched-chain amino acid aminotransferase
LQVSRDWGYNVEERKVSVKEIIDLLKAGKLDGAFGVGTAATIAPIRLINHDGIDYELNQDNTTNFGASINTYLDRLKRGLEEDKHGWNYKIS